MKQKLSLFQRIGLSLFLLLFFFLFSIEFFAFFNLSSFLNNDKNKALMISENRFVAQNYETSLENLLQTAAFLSDLTLQNLSESFPAKKKFFKLSQILFSAKKIYHVSPALFLFKEQVLITESQSFSLNKIHFPRFESLKNSGKSYLFQIDKDPLESEIYFILQFLLFDQNHQIRGVCQIKKMISIDFFDSLKFTHVLVESNRILLNTQDPYQESVPFTKQSTFSLKTRLKNAPWNLISLKKATAFSSELRKRLFILILFSFLLFFLIGLPASSLLSRFILSPLENLRQNLQKISKNPSDTQIKLPDSPDEIGKISFFLKKTQKQLLSYQDQLEDLIQSRTRDLKLSVNELREKENLIQYEIEFAASIQNGILPNPYQNKDILITPLVRQMGKVGGDFIDILKTPDFICSYLADASGHGVPASLITMLIKMSFEYALKNAKTLEELLKEVNNHINLLMNNKNIKFSNYFTLFIVFIHADFGFDFLSAGHVPAIHFHQSDGKCTLLSTPASMIGMFRSSKIIFKPTHSFLEPGDKLLIFSDGYIGVQNPEGKIYGQESLIESLIRHHELKGEALQQALYQDLEQFRQNVPLPDDLSLLLVERTT